jgi:hypothetical protein
MLTPNDDFALVEKSETGSDRDMSSKTSENIGMHLLRFSTEQPSEKTAK